MTSFTKAIAEKDKLEFIKQQMKIANEEDVRRRTCQILKKTDKSDAYYMSLCKIMFINYILSENTKNATIKELIKTNKVLKKRFRDSLNNLKMELCETKFCKSYVLLRLDGCSFRTGIDKLEILQFTASTFELLITVGYTFHMISKAKVKLQQIKLWMTNNKNTPGKPMNLRTPFRRRATEVRPSVAVPSVDVQSNFFAVLKSEPAKTKLSTSNSISDEGFESLVLGSSSSK
ncbi:uncharacterized protein LOC112689429 isoform X2 [Sipha flava]|uniref:Uncharacterized protein LOC112689429 isoform X2 n=1 Tax=Sipha flava TaxID=143950 RepID=A0A8B8G861_9HEMI|nr:uncharacterized protein LOC112689429 isoform X2 [Sipha flava]